MSSVSHRLRPGDRFICQKKVISSIQLMALLLQHLWLLGNIRPCFALLLLLLLLLPKLTLVLLGLYPWQHVAEKTWWSIEV